MFGEYNATAHSQHQPASPFTLVLAGDGDNGSSTRAIFIFMVVVLQLDTVRSQATAVNPASDFCRTAVVSVNVDLSDRPGRL